MRGRSGGVWQCKTTTLRKKQQGSFFSSALCTPDLILSLQDSYFDSLFESGIYLIFTQPDIPSWIYFDMEKKNTSFYGTEVNSKWKHVYVNAFTIKA